MLKQQRADMFFAMMGGLTTFPWRAIIQGQHRLWQHGFGLSEPVEALGPYNWALLHGRMCLADTAALTDDLHKIRRCLRERNMDRAVKRFLPDGGRHPLPRKDPVPQVLEYCSFVRRGINERVLRQLWKTRRAKRVVSEARKRTVREGSVSIRDLG
jgi:hypothetical protein